MNEDLDLMVNETGPDGLQNKRLLTQDELRFIDAHMRKYGNEIDAAEFSSLNISGGLVPLLQNYNVQFSYDTDKKLWTFDLGLHDTHQADSQFTMDAEGRIDWIYKITSISPAAMAYPDPLYLQPGRGRQNGDELDRQKQPEIKGDETSFSAEDRAFLKEALQNSFGGGGVDPFAADVEDVLVLLAKDFELIRMAEKNAYHIQLISKQVPSLEGNIYVKPGAFGVSYESLKPPAVEAVTVAELAMVDEVLKKEQMLWMSTPSNNECLVYDLTEGHKGLLKQNIRPDVYGDLEPIYIQTGKVQRKGREYAVIYYMTDDTVFCLWVDLEKQRLAGANWFSLPSDKGIWLSSEKRDFINKSLASSGAGFLSGRKSLQDIMNNHSLKISDNGDSWALSISPKGNPGSFVGFDIDKKTGELGVPISGH